MGEDDFLGKLPKSDRDWLEKVVESLPDPVTEISDTQSELIFFQIADSINPETGRPGFTITAEEYPNTDEAHSNERVCKINDGHIDLEYHIGKEYHTLSLPVKLSSFSIPLQIQSAALTMVPQYFLRDQYHPLDIHEATTVVVTGPDINTYRLGNIYEFKEYMERIGEFGEIRQIQYNVQSFDKELSYRFAVDTDGTKERPQFELSLDSKHAFNTDGLIRLLRHTDHPDHPKYSDANYYKMLSYMLSQIHHVAK